MSQPTDLTLRVLIVAPPRPEDSGLAEMLAFARGWRFQVDSVSSPGAIPRFLGRRPDALIFDPALFSDSPLAPLLAEWSTRLPACAFLALVDHDQSPAALNALQAGARTLLVRGRFDRSTLPPTVAQAIAWAKSDVLLPAAERSLGDVASHFKEALAIYDLALKRFVHATPPFEKVWARGRSDLVADPAVFFHSFHPADRDRVAAAFSPSGSAEPFSSECRILWPDGSLRWIQLRVVPWNGPSGSARRLAALAEDITASKEIADTLRLREEQLLASESKFRALFAHSPLPMFVFDLETLAYLEVNDAAVAHYGYSRPQFLRMTVGDIRPPEDIPRTLASISRLNSGMSNAGQFRHRLHDGTLIDVEIFAETLEFEGRTAALVVAVDITARRRAERLSEARRSLDRVLAENPPPADAAAAILPIAGATFDWDFAAAFLCAPASSTFLPASSWLSPSRSDSGPFTPAPALLALALSSRAPVWIDDLSVRADLTAGSSPPNSDLLCAAVCPVLSASRLWGVLVFLSRHPRPPADDVLTFLSHTAARLGAFVERREAADQILRNEERVRLVLANSLDAVIEMDSRGRITGWNDQAEHIFGWPRADVLGRDVADTIIPPSHREAHRLGLSRFLETGVGPALNQRLELPALRRDGSVFPVELSIATVRTAAGWSFSAFLRDISQRQRSEQDLRSQTVLLQSILESLGDGVVVADLARTFFIANESAKRLCGGTIESLHATGRAAGLGIFHPDGVTPYQDRDLPLWRAARGEAFDGLEIYLRNSQVPDGRWLVFNGRPLHAEDGSVRAGVVVFHDETIRKRAEEAMRSAKDAAEAASRVKSEFLTNVSHELRTPLNGILGMIELVLTTELTAEQREYVNLARVSAENQLAVVNDILDFAKIEAGRFDVQPVPFSLREQIPASLGSLGVRAGQKGLDFSIDIAPDVPDALTGDPVRLRQVLLNLAGNALKFTEEGAITVAVDRAAVTPSGVLLRFSVADTGIGIDPAKLKAIFEPFVQADGSLTRRYSGTGLGLSIATQLVERMGGRLEVESQPGQGSRFYFTAPFALARIEPAPGPAPSPRPPRPLWTGRGLRILLAEDNPVGQRIVVRFLENEGHSVTTASDGAQALAAWRARSSDPFDLVLLDLQMPGVDGFEVTSVIRQAEASSNARLPIVAITAHAMPDYRDRCLAAGMDAYLAKPFQARQLLEVIGQVMAASPPAA